MFGFFLSLFSLFFCHFSNNPIILSLIPNSISLHSLGLIKANDPSRRFDGYTDKKATKSKILYDVVTKGDQWFATGDLLRKDWFGFYFWVDRIGDTFRWKGENVSTAEVGAAFTCLSAEDTSPLSLIADANVYGVEVPKQDGRAGMARLELVPGKSYKDLNMTELYESLAKQLPSYARPLFLRIPKTVSSIEEGEELTATFKHKKGNLRDEGFNVHVITDEKEEILFFRDDKEKKFVLLDVKLYGDIVNGNIRI